MLPIPRTVTTTLTLFVSAVTGEAQLEAELRYDPSDPLAVALAIGTECGEPVVWTFARDLLATGVGAAAGEGDITIEPIDGAERRTLRLTLATDCVATMTTATDPVVEFLLDSFTLVPSGTELDHIDLEAEIAALLG